VDIDALDIGPRSLIDHEGDVDALGPDRGAFNDARLEKSVMVRREVRQLTSLTAGHSRQAGPWTLDIDGAFALTSEREPDSMEAIFHADTDLAYAGTGPIPALMPTSAVGSDPSAFVLDQILNERNDSRDREEHLRVDARRDLSVGERPAFLKFGVKARRREKTNDVDITTFDGFGREVLLSEFATTNDYPFGDFGPVIAERSSVIRASACPSLRASPSQSVMSCSETRRSRAIAESLTCGVSCCRSSRAIRQSSFGFSLMTTSASAFVLRRW